MTIFIKIIYITSIHLHRIVIACSLLSLFYLLHFSDVWFPCNKLILSDIHAVSFFMILDVKSPKFFFLRLLVVVGTIFGTQGITPLPQFQIKVELKLAASSVCQKLGSAIKRMVCILLRQQSSFNRRMKCTF